MPDPKLQAPFCRTCGKPLFLLDQEEQRWYCYKDDEVFYGKEYRWGRQSDATRRPAVVQVARKVCVNCGAAIGPGLKFCYTCGQALRIDVQAALNATIKIIRTRPVILVPVLLEYVASGLLTLRATSPLMTRWSSEMFSPIRTTSPWPFLAQAFLILILFGVTVVPLVLGMYPVMVKEAVRGERINLLSAFRNSLRKFASLVASYILAIAVVLLASFAFIVPGLIAATWYYYAIPAIVLENRGARGGMSASKAFARDKKWGTFVILILAYAPSFIGYVLLRRVSIYLWYGIPYFTINLFFSFLSGVLFAVMGSYVYLTFGTPKERYKGVETTMA